MLEGRNEGRQERCRLEQAGEFEARRLWYNAEEFLFVARCTTAMTAMRGFEKDAGWKIKDGAPYSVAGRSTKLKYIGPCRRSSVFFD